MPEEKRSTFKERVKERVKELKTTLRSDDAVFKDYHNLSYGQEFGVLFLAGAGLALFISLLKYAIGIKQHKDESEDDYNKRQRNNKSAITTLLVVGLLFLVIGGVLYKQTAPKKSKASQLWENVTKWFSN